MAGGTLKVTGRDGALDLIRLTPLMELTCGRPDVVIGLIDGPLSMSHPDLADAKIQEITAGSGNCFRATSAACRHATFMAGILSASRTSLAPAISPDCTLLVRPIFTESVQAGGAMPSASLEELSQAIIDCAKAGARVLNISAAAYQQSLKGERELQGALGEAGRRGILVVAAAGNQGVLGSSVITRHPWVIPVVAYDLSGRLMEQSNLAASIGMLGLGAPGDGVTSLIPAGGTAVSGGTSVATPFVTGSIALVWSQFPSVTAVEVKFAMTHAGGPRRRALVPPILDAWAAYEAVARSHGRNS